uniref:NADH dehydrogenase subunit 3 n=1 Tax=Lema decempunctata TaxID=1412118 RepID=UPI0022A69BAE|nr:NADH dehydrogenase subunit 3 [Lema decempunctata]UZS91163.1 NADH dehydrogenase subunit 3 [Lema decempunctata]
MKILLSLFFMIILIMMILLLILNLVSKKTFYDQEKNSPFECGFDMKSSARTPFSLHFFLISIIFLIFDVEITLLLPLMMIMKMVSLINYLMTSFIIIMILLMGLFHEWIQGALNWSN